MKKLAIIGAGAWGSALSIALWQKFERIDLIAHKTENGKKRHPDLPVDYSANTVIGDDLSEIQNVDFVLVATPSFAFFETLEKIEPFIKNQKIAWATKGLDTKNECLLHQSFDRIFPQKNGTVISGPSFAAEVAAQKPTALVVASRSKKARDNWAEIFQTATLRAYTNADVTGVEIGGAVKNILAIAAGIAAALTLGANTQAALITRGLAEMSRFGQSLGARRTTFMGLAGLGDLVLTCADDLSRNRRFGKMLVALGNAKRAKAKINRTVEGLNILPMTLRLAREKAVEMPICEQVSAVVDGKTSGINAIENLMQRKTIAE